MSMSAVNSGQALQRQSLAMLKVDLVESVRLSDNPRDEQQVAHRWRDFIETAQRTLIAQSGGRIVHREGDGMLLAVDNSARAAQLAFGLHRLLPQFNRDVAARTHLFLRIGVHEGMVLSDQHDLYGRGVNLAARLKDLAGPGQTICSTKVRESLIEGVDARFEDLGECHLKHMRLPVRAFRLLEIHGSQQPMRANADEPSTLPPPDNKDLRIALAVVPFQTQADTRHGAAAGELFADAIIATLSKAAHLRLISRMSTRALAHRGLGAQRNGQLLRARFVLSGRVTVQAKRLFLVAELADAHSGEVVWANTFGCNASELLAGDSDLVAGTASAVSLAILQRELQQVRSQPLPNLASYTLLLGGITLMHRFGRADFQRAQACLEALTQRAPRHAEPHAWLARWHVFKVVQGWTDNPRREWQQALTLCQKARELDPGSAIALTVEGSARIRMDKDLNAAMRLYREALDHNPNEPLAHLLLGTAHTFKGEGQIAVEHAERAVALTPLDPMRFFYDSHAGAAHLTAGNMPRAIELAQRSLRSNRMHFSTLHTLGIAQSLAGDVENARTTVAQILDHEPGLTASSFLERSPGGAFSHARRYAEALVRAGLPAGTSIQ